MEHAVYSFSFLLNYIFCILLGEFFFRIMVGNGEPFMCGYCSVELENWDTVLEHDCFQGNDSLVLQNKNTVYLQAENIDNSLFGGENCEWGKDAVLLLIEKYQENREFLEKKNAIKRHIWKKISQEMHTAGHNYSWDQIQNKWKGLIRTYRNIKMFNNNNSGRNRKKWEFFEILDNILKDSITIETPIIIVHNGEQSIPQEPSTSTTTTTTITTDSKFDLDIHNYAVDMSNTLRKRKREHNDHYDDDDDDDDNDDTGNNHEIVNLLKMTLEQNKRQHEDDLREKRRFNALFEKLIDAINKK